MAATRKWVGAVEVRVIARAIAPSAAAWQHEATVAARSARGKPPFAAHTWARARARVKAWCTTSEANAALATVVSGKASRRSAHSTKPARWSADGAWMRSESSTAERTWSGVGDSTPVILRTSQSVSHTDVHSRRGWSKSFASVTSFSMKEIDATADEFVWQ